MQPLTIHTGFQSWFDRNVMLLVGGGSNIDDLGTSQNASRRCVACNLMVYFPGELEVLILSF